jgi:V-type H+-transporting ATPase subunit a
MSFVNSLKMKMAVIFGVTHMLMGLCLRLFNNWRRSQWLDLITLTIPQIIFMSCTFVYMDFIIIYKWSSIYTDTSKAPSIITTMIAVFVNFAKQDPKDLLFWPEERSF